MVQIRDGESRDLAALTALYRALYAHLTERGLTFSLDEGGLESSLGAALRSKLCFLAVAEEEGELKGFLSAGIVRMDRKLNFRGGNTMGLIHDLYLSPEVRGQGLAGELLDRAENWFRAAEVKVIECQVVSGNEEGAAFWARRGYAPVSVTRMKALATEEDSNVVLTD